MACIGDGRKRREFGRKDGRFEYGSTRTAQFSVATYCQTNLLQALPAGAIASPPSVAALLIGLKGVLNPKAQVQARRDVTL